MKVRNRMRILMAEKKVSSVLKISRDTGLDYGTLLNFYHERFENFNNKVIATLCEYFGCQIDDLLELVEEKVS
ncbi:helix-turn-helix transcriptional regulator [Bacillus sp. Gen3]|uniref:helix-turn-helix domain-containing protein n=1 Tax=Heyndrickxia oleronia TaxID=38875 RepID=UPI0015D22770|nr:helix-turn-helix transcriptional regulator [Heyndrickxia oleronia]NYV64616.1 helix-turn-helix transcriptional regulator [Bacillus sp. Gen3]GIN38406.1 hypothetical protein J19TS1_13550 [Heyndrickxia oleronia]